MPVRKKRIYTHRTTHGRGADARTAIIIIVCLVALFVAGMLFVFFGDSLGGGQGKKPAAQPQPAGVLRR
ncbi:MAG: hypothetical protein ABIH66_13310 [bacterium]